jgi:hypothetical protein
MTASAQDYQALPGRSVALAGYHRLYQGPDHLLLAANTGYSQNYRKFYFRDIQAIVVLQNQVRLVWNWIWGGLLFCDLAGWLVVLAAVSSVQTGWLIFSVVVTFLLALPLLINMLLGPTCTCYLQTAVQIEPLPCLRRLRTADRVLRQIQPLLESAQGSLSSEDLQLLNPAAAPPVSGPSAVASPPRAGQVLRPGDRRLHRLLSWLLLADLPITLLALTGPRWTHIPSMILFSGTCIVAIIAAVRQRGTDLPIALRFLPWMTLGIGGLSQAAGLSYGIYLGAQGKPGLLLNVTSLDDPVLRALAIGSTALAVFLGGFGLLQLARDPARPPGGPPVQTPPPPPSPQPPP